MEDIELNTKVVIIGNSGVGKTSICNRYFNNKFDENTISTYGTSYVTKVLKINNKSIKMMVFINYQFWDTAGQDRLRTVMSIYYKGIYYFLDLIIL